MEKCDRFVSKRYDRHFYVGESLETIKLAIQKNNYSSVELLDNTKFDFYADLFYKSDTRKIKELILSRTMCDPNDKQSAELRDIFEGVKHLEGLVFTYNTEILSSIYILQNLCRLTVHGVIDDKDSNLYLSLGPLRSLTHLHIDSEEECIKMLNKLCDSPDNRILRDKLTHLVLQMPCGHGSVFRTTIFESLEVLIMGPLSGAAVPPTFWSGFPSRLREIKIDGLTISCGALFHLIGDLRHLQLLNVGNGDIFADNDLDCGLDDFKVVSLIEEVLVRRNTVKTLNIFYYRQFGPMTKVIHKSKTTCLQIIRYVAEEPSSQPQKSALKF